MVLFLPNSDAPAAVLHMGIYTRMAKNMWMLQND